MYNQPDYAPLANELKRDYMRKMAVVAAYSNYVEKVTRRINSGEEIDYVEEYQVEQDIREDEKGGRASKRTYEKYKQYRNGSLFNERTLTHEEEIRDREWLKKWEKRWIREDRDLPDNIDVSWRNPNYRNGAQGANSYESHKRPRKVKRPNWSEE